MKRFIKNSENFTCGFCGEMVFGNGYTNHCPHCLWSLHVDINPGDRLSGCNSLMKPTFVTVSNKNKEFVITHICEKCGHRKNNRIVTTRDIDPKIGQIADNFNMLIEIQKNNNQEIFQGWK